MRKNGKNRILLGLLILVLVLLTACGVETETLNQETETETSSSLEEGSSMSQVEMSQEENRQGEEESSQSSEEVQSSQESQLEEGESYYTAEDVAAYIHLYGELPDNYITKAEAEEMGWSVENAKGYVIGGDRFGNREGLLPEESGRQYYECDLIEGYTDHRGPVRLVYSNDGLIFYTDDHYDSFTRLY